MASKGMVVCKYWQRGCCNRYPCPFLHGGDNKWVREAKASKKDKGGMEVIYTHTEEHGVLALRETSDATGQSVLSCSVNDQTVRLYNLPSFLERGRIFAKKEVQALQTGPDGLFFTGDGTGDLKVWKW